jgi:ribosomal protein S18 acetylase RimI-like enzyme
VETRQAAGTEVDVSFERGRVFQGGENYTVAEQRILFHVAADNGCEAIYLTVHRKNLRAIRFYGKPGCPVWLATSGAAGGFFTLYFHNWKRLIAYLRDRKKQKHSHR